MSIFPLFQDFPGNSEAYVEPNQTYMMERIFENSYRLNGFQQMIDWALYMPLKRCRNATKARRI